LDETILPIPRPMREIFDRFRLPGVAHEIRQQRHQGEALAGSELGMAGGSVDLQVAPIIDQRHPFGTNVSQLRRVLLERSVTVRIAVRIKRQPHFVVRPGFSFNWTLEAGR
jgi:hypothetical protein